MENKLQYIYEPQSWTDALPIGNGKLGAMIFGNTGIDRIQLNEDSLWSGGYRKRVNTLAKDNYQNVRHLLDELKINQAEKLAKETMFPSFAHMNHYQTAGDVWVEFDNEIEKKVDVHNRNEMGIPEVIEEELKVEDYVRELDIEKAVANINYTVQEENRKIKSFASSKENIIVYQISGKDLNCSIRYTRRDLRSGRGATYIDKVTSSDSGLILAEGHNGSVSKGISFSVGIQVKQKDGKMQSNGSGIIIKDASEIVLYITVSTSFREKNPSKHCKERLENSSSKKLETIFKTHQNDYQKLYNSFSLNLSKEKEVIPTDKRLKKIEAGYIDTGLVELYFNYARYLLISSSNKNSLPSNLQGIWNEDFSPAWGSKYTININTEMNYWIAGQTSLNDCVLPLLNHLERMHEKGREVAQEMYGLEGFVCHHNTDIWGDCAPQDNGIATIWPTGGAWLCLSIWKHYEYTADKDLLMRYFPILEDAVRFFDQYMYQDENGNWGTGPSVSPENMYITPNNEVGALANSPTMDIQIITELFYSYLKASKVINKTTELTNSISEKVKKLTPIIINEQGYIQEWKQDFQETDKGHRHISHLYGLYPGELIDVDNNLEEVLAAKKTLETRIKNGGGHTGWSQAWILNLWAKLREPTKVIENIHLLLAKSTYPNLFDKHPPFQIDGNFGGAAGILQCFIQEDSDSVLLLPSLPEEFSEGEIKNYRCKHGVFINLQWKDKEITTLELNAFRDTDIKIKEFDTDGLLSNINIYKLKKGQNKLIGGKRDGI